MIKLYRAPLSTNVERVALALAYKGLEAESTEIDYSDRSLVQQVSGQGLVPVIDDDGEIVNDSIRIFHHLDERYPDPPLFPSEPPRRAEMDVFIDWFNEVWKSAPNAIADELETELEGDSPDRELIAGEGARMAERLDLFERMLEGRDYLMGPEISAADLAAFPFLKYALYPKQPDDDEPFHLACDEYQQLGDDHPRLTAWIGRIAALPQV